MCESAEYAADSTLRSVEHRGKCWESDNDNGKYNILLEYLLLSTSGRRSFRETGTVEKLTSQAEIDVAFLQWSGGITPVKILTSYMQNPAIYCILAGKWFAMP